MAILGTRFRDFDIERETLPDVELVSGPGRSRAEIVEVARGAALILAGAAPRFDRETLEDIGVKAIVRLGVGVDSVDPEAARSLGMSHARAMGSIVIPQAFRVILPPLTNELVLLLKDTSLLFVLGTTDQTIELAKYGRDAVADTFNGTPLVAVALVYLAITFPLTRAVAWLERRQKRAVR